VTGAVASQPRFARSIRANPYVGLVPYTEADSDWFFGREREERIIVANLRAARLTLLYGASGVGKSSVLLAGVVPRLQQLAGEDGPARSALTVFSAWRDAPLEPLARAMRDAVIAAADDDEEIEAWETRGSLHDAAQRWGRHVRTQLVVLDQFEEYFLYHPDEDGPGTLAGELPALVNDPALRVNVLLSLREDALAGLDRFKGRIPDLYANYLRVDYLDRRAARDAVVEPIERYNRQTGVEPVALEDPLVERVLDEVRTGRLTLGEEAPAVPVGQEARARDDRVETPFLQLVMERLWSAREDGDAGGAMTVATLDSLGGAEAIVSHHLDEAMGRLPPADQRVAADVLVYLVTPSRSKIAQRAVDLAVWTGHEESDVQRVLDTLASRELRILRSVPPPPGQDRGPEPYEIFHDVLADAVVAWRNRQDAERAQADLLARHEAEVAEKQRRRHERRMRLLRRGAVGLLVVLALAVAGVVLLVSAANRKSARARTLAANSVAQLGGDPELSLLLALAAIDDKSTPQGDDALRRALEASRVRAALGPARDPACGAACVLGRPGMEGQRVGAQTAPVAFSSDGAHLAVVTRGRARLWDPRSGAVRVLPIAKVRGVAFSPDGRRVLAVSENQGLVASVEGGSATQLRVVGLLTVAAFSRDGRFVAGGGEGEATVWDAQTGEMVRHLRQPSEPMIVGLAFSPRESSELLTTGTYSVPRDRKSVV